MRYMKDPEICRVMADVSRLNGQLVRLVGIYKRADPLDLRKKQVRVPGEPPSRRAWIVLSDGEKVLLEPSWAGAEGNRPEAEIQLLEGKEVVVTGTIFRVTPAIPPGGKYPVQTLCVPTLQKIQDIVPMR